MADQEVTEHNIKILFAIIGDSMCGKSCLFLRFVDNTFQNSYITTLRFEFRNRVIGFNGKNLRFLIWDTAGQERFRSTIRSFFDRFQGFMIVFDLTERRSFNSLPNWINEIHELEKPFIIIGAKSDLVSQRQVTYEEVREFAENNRSCYIEISNATGYNVWNSVKLIINEIMSRLN